MHFNGLRSVNVVYKLPLVSTLRQYKTLWYTEQFSNYTLLREMVNLSFLYNIQRRTLGCAKSSMEPGLSNV